MSEKHQLTYVESVSSATVTLNSALNNPPSNAGVGIRKVVITTVESTAEAGFWGATGTCQQFEVIVRRMT